MKKYIITKFVDLFNTCEQLDKLDALYNDVIKDTDIETRIEYCERLIDRLTFELKQDKCDCIKNKVLLKKSAMTEIRELSKNSG